MAKRVFRENFWLILIFILALFLRTYRLDKLPFAFHQDEVMNGYVGRYILENGKDLYGNHWPLLYFNRFQDYPNVIPMYWSGLGTYFFGVNEFGVRFPVALAGAVAVILVYRLSFLIFKKKETALFSSFLLSILPWHIVMSRATAEGVIGLTVFIWGLILILGGILKERPKKISFSFLLFFACYFLYPSYRLAVPLTILGLTFFYWREKNVRIFLSGGTIFFFILTFLIGTTVWGKGRFLETSLFHREDMAAILNSKNQKLAEDLGPNRVILARIFHNKPIAYTREYFNQFFNYLSPGFLFLQMGPPDRYTVPEQGLFYLTCLGLIFFIFLHLPRIDNKKILAFCFYLLLVTIASMAITVEDTPNIHRSMLIILPMVIFISQGYQSLAGVKLVNFKPKIFAFFFLLAEFIYFWFQYSNHTASFKSVVRNDGNREAVKIVIENEKNYDQIYLPVYDSLPIYYLFYSHNFSSSLAGQFRIKLEIDKVGKVNFIDHWCPSNKLIAENSYDNVLIVESLDGVCRTEGKYQELPDLTIYRQDETKAYKFLVSANE